MKLLRWIAWLLSLAAPRFRRKWAFGCYGDRFGDNSKHLFLHVCRSHPEVAAVWISGNAAVVRRIRELGHRAFTRWSAAGIFHTLTAKVFVVSSYVSDVNVALSGGARVVNLWHGIPLKKIEFDITRGPLAQVFRPATRRARLAARFGNPHVYRRPDLISVPSPTWDPIYRSAFRVGADALLHAGFPRNDLLLRPEGEVEAHARRVEPPAVTAILAEMRGAERAFLYLPTWRDSGAPALGMPGFDWEAMDRLLSARGWRLFVKLHPNERLVRPGAALGAIRFVDGVDDVYPLLRFADCVITDYSSVAFDFLLLRRPVIFVPWDLEEYLRTSRELYFDFEDLIPGPAPRTFGELTAAMERTVWDAESDAQRSLRVRMWGADAREACPEVFKAVTDRVDP